MDDPAALAEQIKQLTFAVHALETKSFLEQANWTSQIVLVVIALMAAIFTRRQLDHLKGESEERTKQTKATFLLELDKMFESEPMAKARHAFVVMNQDIEKSVPKDLAGTERERWISTEFSRKLYALRDADIPAYIQVMKLCGFFETVGSLVGKGYVDAKDIIDLYKGPIHFLYNATKIHIEKRQEGMPAGFLSNFSALARHPSLTK